MSYTQASDSFTGSGGYGTAGSLTDIPLESFKYLYLKTINLL